jgi:hypothetical protein
MLTQHPDVLNLTGCSEVNYFFFTMAVITAMRKPRVRLIGKSLRIYKILYDFVFLRLHFEILSEFLKNLAIEF